jgi:hypothetical protein
MNVLVILFIIILASVCTCIGMYYRFYITGNVPSSLPAWFQFNKASDTKYLGHVFQQLTDVSESDCISKCSSNPFCIGATYDTKKSLCSLQWQNSKTLPSFVTSWSGTNSYSIINPQYAVEIKTGYKSNGTNIKSNPASSINDCINQCIGDDPDCKSANFNASTRVCEYLISNTDMGDQLSADNNYTFVSRKGLVGNSCKSNNDCIYGLCRNNVCLVGSPLQSGADCNVDSDCVSGQCLSQTISFADQEVQRQQLLSNGDPSTVTCDTYKTCKDCQEKLVSGEKGKDSARYSGAKCVWRYSQDLSNDILNKSCEDRQALIPAGVTAKCFPKTIATSKKTCK